MKTTKLHGLLGRSAICAGALLLLGASADIRVTKSADVAEVKVGEDVRFTLTVANDGPDPSGVSLTDVLSPSFELDFATVASPGPCAGGPTLFCIMTLDPGTSAVVAYTAKAVAKGTSTNTVSVTTSADVADTDLSDNEDQASVTVSSSGGGCQLIR